MNQSPTHFSAAHAVPAEAHDTLPPIRHFAFDGTIGHLHPASGSVGMVICNPWGFDELCTRKFHRILADQLAGRGVPVLRFDYPGEGDALPASEAGLAGWVEGALAAARELQARTGCAQVAFYGMGVGAAVALRAAHRFDHTAGLVMAAPVLNGRRYLRETELRDRVIQSELGLDHGYAQGSTTLAGFIMPPAVAADVKGLKLDGDKLRFPSEMPVLLLQRPDDGGDAQALEVLQGLGLTPETGRFADYGAMMDGLNISVIPQEPLAEINRFAARHWVGGGSVVRTTEPRPESRVTADEAGLLGEGFREQPLTFGGEQAMFGVLCAPTDMPVRATLILLNMAYTYHIGWGGLWVQVSRQLAQHGIATLRVDLSNIGDSRASSSGPLQVIYSDQQLADIRSVVNGLKETGGPGEAPIFMAGTCSGAYSALHFAAANADIAGVVSINQLRMIWDPDEDVEQALRTGARTISDYKRRAFNPDTYRRVLRGEVDMVRAARHILRHGRDRVMKVLTPYLGSLTKLGRMRRRLADMLKVMEARGVPVVFANCRTDGSLDHMSLYFGSDLGGIGRHSNVRLSIIEGSDHMLTPLAARRQVVEILLDTMRDGTTRPSPEGSGSAPTL